MIRSNQLILKADLFNKLHEFKVSTVAINKLKNAKLRNPALCRVYVYHDYSVKGLIDQLKLMYNSGLIPDEVNAAIEKLLSSHENGFIRLTFIKRLLEFEKEHDILFYVSKSIRNLITELQ